MKKAEAAGYKNLKELQKEHVKLKAGDKVYAVCMDKSIVLFIIGQEPLENGMNILGAHIDSPRIDVKQNPLYENEELAYLDTHYYGGIKKYQWVTLPLALHGVIAKKDGTIVPVSIGDEEEDPVFVITDLLVHLASKQLEKKGSVVVEGEKLDLLIGSRPLEQDPSLDQEEKEAVRANVMELLKKYYDMEEEDFLSAELEIVPAGKARDCGLDRSMVLAYGQDDRVCAFTSLFAILDTPQVTRTGCCILVDKEEIGSVGATGMHSRFFENTVAEVMNACGTYSELLVRRALKNSCMLSSDVSAGFDRIQNVWLILDTVVGQADHRAGAKVVDDRDVVLMTQLDHLFQRNLFAEAHNLKVAGVDLQQSAGVFGDGVLICLLYTSPSPRDS